ncbi:Urocanate hydratase [Chamberlinius hualienensis]
MADLKVLALGIPFDQVFSKLWPGRDPTIPHAPIRTHGLSLEEKKLAVRNALRYFPSEFHETLAIEFANELEQFGHIYMYRFRSQLQMKAYPLKDYPAKSKQAAAIMHMIMNNLDPAVAQFPHELVTYGGNGQAFSNWAQFWIAMKYLSELEDDQTLVMYSGHPLGVFPSSPNAPRMVISNGMVIPNYSSRKDYDRMFALSVTMYGQMTAGSYCYIGPQGIVHGTTLTVLNAGRKYLGLEDLSGKVFVTAGLGGMSGAQAKASVICGCVGVIAEVCLSALTKRYNQGWLKEMYTDLDLLINRIKKAKKEKETTSIGYHGNVVDVWERLVIEYEKHGELLVDLGSDQTSCHNPFNGGYYPVQLSFEDANEMMANDPLKFKQLVQESLRRQISAINKLSSSGMFFWDYGNAFLLESHRAGADVLSENSTSDSGSLRFRYPSYVQDIMGDIFSLGFGPFRWVCTSADPEDLRKSDEIALIILNRILISTDVSRNVKQQYGDNIRWIATAGEHNLVVGSQARILYSDQQGRIQIAKAFNEAIRDGRISAPIVISRDHHDVSGADSPFRETSNIYDGSAFTADMAIQNFVGDSFRGATWVAIHNGGGVGWGEVINGGFGLVLDGSDDASFRAEKMLDWDVLNGVSRRCWSGNENAEETIKKAMLANDQLKVTLPNHVKDSSIIDKAF